MPVNPFPIEIVVNDSDDNTESGAGVYIINVTKGTQTDEGTTNGSGAVIIELANLPLAAGQTVPYSVGDVVKVIAYTSTESGIERFVVTGLTYSTTISMDIINVIDALSTMKTLLDNNWNPQNSNSLTPNVATIYGEKLIDVANFDQILLYMVDEPVDPFGIGATHWQHDRIVSIDIRTSYKRANIKDIRGHLMKLKTEVLRVLKKNVKDPDSDHHHMVPLRIRDLSDRSIGIGRNVIDASLKNWDDFVGP